MVINKESLARRMSERTDLTPHQAMEALNSGCDVVTRALKQKDEVRLNNFGSIRVRHRRRHKGRNPWTGQPVMVSARDVPVFKAGRRLRIVVDPRVIR